MITITVVGSGLKRLEEATRILGESRARSAYSRAINRAGKEASKRTAVALTAQTGLPKRTAPKALRKHVKYSNPGTLEFAITAKGGNVRLKFFKARETRKGVSAAPWNQRQVFASTFMRAGFWPNRVAKPSWNRQVFRRDGSGGFENVKSDVFIPEELMIGQSAAAWKTGAASLQSHVNGEVRRMSKGVLS